MGPWLRLLSKLLLEVVVEMLIRIVVRRISRQVEEFDLMRMAQKKPPPAKADDGSNV